MADNPRRQELKKMISNRITHELGKRGWSTNLLYDCINAKMGGRYEFPKATIYDCCKGVSLPAPDCLAAIANVLEVSVDYLLGLIDTNVRLNPDDVNFGNNILKFVDWFNVAVGEDKKIVIIINDKTNSNQNTKAYMDGTNQNIKELILEDYNKLMIFPSSKIPNKICNINRFILFNGNIYPESIYKNEKIGISEHTSYYDLINLVAKEDTLLGIKYLRELHSAYRRDRYLYGGLGRIKDIDFFLLNYMMGYFYKVKA